MLDDAVIGHVRMAFYSFFLAVSSSVQVTTVGQVIRVQKQATNSVYDLHDGTGHIEVRHWNETTNEEDDIKWGGIQCVRVQFSLGFCSVILCLEKTKTSASLAL